MAGVDLSQYFKTDKIKGQPLNSPEDVALCLKLNEEMRLVKLDFAHKSAQSMAFARHMVLRYGRSG